MARDLRNLKQKAVAGAAAGNVTVTGIKVGDKLLAVLDITTPADRTAEFTITALNTINNTGGTTTAAKVVLVTWISADARGAALI